MLTPGKASTSSSIFLKSERTVRGVRTWSTWEDWFPLRCDNAAWHSSEPLSSILPKSCTIANGPLAFFTTPAIEDHIRHEMGASNSHSREDSSNPYETK